MLGFKEAQNPLKFQSAFSNSLLKWKGDPLLPFSRGSVDFSGTGHCRETKKELLLHGKWQEKSQ